MQRIALALAFGIGFGCSEDEPVENMCTELRDCFADCEEQDDACQDACTPPCADYVEAVQCEERVVAALTAANECRDGDSSCDYVNDECEAFPDGTLTPIP